MSGLSTSLEDSNLITLALSLRQTLEPSTRAYAEKQLEVEEQRPNFSISLLQLVTNDTLEITEEESKIQPEIRKTIKDTIIDILIAVPTTLQTQLIESITIIADSDFPDDWENLLPKLIHNFSQDDFVRNNAILLTAHSIFKKWKHQFKSDPLYKEINYVLDIFCEPFFQLLQQNNNNKENLQLFSNTLLLLLKVFYDLNCQDLPPFFEDNWEACMNLFHKYITYQNPLLETQSEEEAGTLEKIKSSVCEIIILYTNKYEEISTMLPQFVNTIWNFLTTIGLEPKYDILVSKAMTFLSTVAKLERYQVIFKNLFNNDEAIKQFCEKIVLPNMYFRVVDEELFEFDPIEYIRRDLEGSGTAKLFLRIT
ncbi:10954_t:CDS:2 [Entrophospora sp. SA101]|nr:10954_t:CDS:2 [Entrophospora sp. SA101]